MSLKLNKANREEIIAGCVKATFKQAESDLEALRTQLADAIYDAAHAEAEKIERKLPKGWVSEVSRIAISCSGFTWNPTRDPSQPHNTLKLSRSRLEPRHSADEYKIAAQHPLFDQAQTIVQMHGKLHDAKQALREQLNTLLYSVATVAKLREVWPEGAEYFPEEEKRVALPVPHSLTRQINQMMGIRA
jgi:hypothetical protein